MSLNMNIVNYEHANGSLSHQVGCDSQGGCDSPDSAPLAEPLAASSSGEGASKTPAELLKEWNLPEADAQELLQMLPAKVPAKVPAKGATPGVVVLSSDEEEAQLLSPVQRAIKRRRQGSPAAAVPMRRQSPAAAHPTAAPAALTAEWVDHLGQRIGSSQMRAW